jgi:uncharacterized membrane protein
MKYSEVKVYPMAKLMSTSSKIKHKAAVSLAHIIMVAVPLLAGIDKYFNFITEWEHYVSPVLRPFLPMSPKRVMYCAGVAEIAIGLTAVAKPRRGSIALALMLFSIIANLLTMKKQLHIASLDGCLACFALVFALLLPEAESA